MNAPITPPDLALDTDSGTASNLTANPAVRKRAIELALIGGRSVTEVSQFDWDQAASETRGEPPTEPIETNASMEHDQLLRAAQAAAQST